MCYKFVEGIKAVGFGGWNPPYAFRVFHTVLNSYKKSSYVDFRHPERPRSSGRTHKKLSP